MRHFVFNNKSSKDFFSFTKSITRPFLPSINVPSITIPNRAGAVALRKNIIGVREFAIEVVLLGLNDGDLRTKIRALADFLIYDEDKPLYFSDEPNRIYYARFNGSSNDLEEIAAIGEGEIVFTCFDPFAYSNAESTFAIGTQGQFNLVNGGNVEVFPLIRIVPSAEVPYIKIRNLTTGKIFTYLAAWAAGAPFMVDMDKNIAYNETTGEIFLANVALDSEFWSLAKGTNTIKIETNDVGGAALTSGRATWIERFY